MESLVDGRVNEFEASPEERLEALKGLAAAAGARPWAPESNNHIHTIYSFSPYAPAAAALKAREAGLRVAGSVDHDSLAAASEMRSACSILGMGCVTGFEIRARLDPEGPFARRKVNNPDSEGIIYMTVQGVPSQAAPEVAAFLQPIRQARLERSRAMAEKANSVLRGLGLSGFDFDADVLGRSKFAEGGTITERHILQALALSLVQGFGRGEALTRGLETRLGLRLAPKLRATIADPANPYLVYDLLGLLKADFLPSVFIQPGTECVSAAQAVEFALSIGAIPAYAYLGDVGESPTSDKKAEKFEDDYLEELFEEILRLGFLAIAYMPPRNTALQLERVRRLCARFGLMEISGVDINQPRQRFDCPELRRSEFAHLNASTWALVAHEALASLDPRFGLFSSQDPCRGLPLGERIALYAEAGLRIGLGEAAESAAESLASSLYKGRKNP